MTDKDETVIKAKAITLLLILEVRVINIISLNHIKIIILYPFPLTRELEDKNYLIN